MANILERDIRCTLITGATGFVGYHLAEFLRSRGICVRALVRNPEKASPLRDLGVEIAVGDITRPETLPAALEGIGTVFHAAAVLGPAHLPHAVYRDVNVTGTRNLVEACRAQSAVERFVHVSSVAVLGPLPDRTVACEGTPPKPQDIYEITKWEAEEYVLGAAGQGFPAVIARPAWVYGPGDTRTLKLFRMIARRRFLQIGKAENKQHPIWIGDLVEGLVRCATVQGIEGRVYHLGGPDIVRVHELCQTIADAAGVTLFPFHPPVWLACIPGWIVEKLFAVWGGEPPVDHRKVAFFVINRAYSIHRAAEELGWTPKIRFREGVSRTIQWYREHRWI